MPRIRSAAKTNEPFRTARKRGFSPSRSALICAAISATRCIIFASGIETVNSRSRTVILSMNRSNVRWKFDFCAQKYYFSFKKVPLPPAFFPIQSRTSHFFEECGSCGESLGMYCAWSRLLEVSRKGTGREGTRVANSAFGFHRFDNSSLHPSQVAL